VSEGVDATYGGYRPSMGLTVRVGTYAWFGLVTTMVMTLAVVAFILLFERRRAQAIERDLRERPTQHRE
jgi:protein-S-isoprenylcysteine O-methyltransferase Ste14